MTQLPTVTVGLQRLKGHPFISDTIPVTFDFKQIGKQHYAFFSSLNTPNATIPPQPNFSYVATNDSVNLVGVSITWDTRLGNSSGGVILSREDVTARPLNLRKRFWNIALVPGSQLYIILYILFLYIISSRIHRRMSGPMSLRNGHCLNHHLHHNSLHE